ncbi:GNAT family N-acetyltransferase [Sphingobacterium hungaricum]|uniref:GNAT family N-acetyltransferase n=1 Tax=Sphingobacterium hungaricum TaxID=2082723 RepID=A0A928YRW7_9SPHI|nr:GNAT family N-acetyltransferase [Sphingobacterium hungaricum]MBE8715394.1 GNAT family N-acetyltransferase [Sphingobacterium hungaricum]
MDYSWAIKEFQELSATELYKILQLRIDVFMLEQDCLYPECDNKDFKSAHIFAQSGEQIIAYARLVHPGISYSESSIGRVVVHKDFRKFGLGKELMVRSIEQVLKTYPNRGIRISAQAHLQKFYEELGFLKVSDEYLEDNIPHIEMLHQSA